MTLVWDLCQPYRRERRPFECELGFQWFKTREAFDSVTVLMVPQLQTRPNSAVGGGPRLNHGSMWALNHRPQRGSEKVQGLRKDAGLGVP